MQVDDLTSHGVHVMTVCNSCRYCEQYCPVFPAIEQRLAFGKTELAYLANLCHNCGECLYACQYAPPHEFGIDVPRTLAQIRHRSYEEYAYPRWLARAFSRSGAFSAIVLAGSFALVLFTAALTSRAEGLLSTTDANFYRVVPYEVMVTLFGVVALAVLTALVVGMRRCWRDLQMPSGRSSALQVVRDVLTLRHLHASGDDCVTSEERRSPWRRWWHHCTFYGFALCFASTSVAALYHAQGYEAPYEYASLPVVLGTAGGIGLLIGPAGLWFLRRRRDPALTDPNRNGLDEAFLILLFATSLTGVTLLLFREAAAMGALLIVHLAVVLALFLTLPYGKFVHGLYRTVALLKYAREADEGTIVNRES